MSAALADGTIASFAVSDYDTAWFREDTVAVTVDHRIDVYLDHPEGDGHTDIPFAVQQPSCTGTFHATPITCPFGGSGAAVVTWDGCP
ncbi:MAG TPA: hypothetical protein VGC41_16805 [Kofleriaceae bacterium]